jgi:hypothetical protein
VHLHHWHPDFRRSFSHPRCPINPR